MRWYLRGSIHGTHTGAIAVGWASKAVGFSSVVIGGVVTSSAVIASIIGGIFLILNSVLTILITRYLEIERERHEHETSTRSKHSHHA